MFRSPLDILAGAAIALTGPYLLFASLFFPSMHSGVLRDYKGWAVFLSWLLISTEVLGVIRTWKKFFVDTRLPSPPRLFKEGPAGKKQD